MYLYKIFIQKEEILYSTTLAEMCHIDDATFRSGS